MTPQKLTKRQFQIWLKIAQGRSDKEIARLLGLNANTVHRHTCRLYRRLQVTNRTEAALAFLFVERMR